jgi:hypothetical protein
MTYLLRLMTSSCSGDRGRDRHHDRHRHFRRCGCHRQAAGARDREDELARVAERAVANSGWLPKPLRAAEKKAAKKA